MSFIRADTTKSLADLTQSQLEFIERPVPECRLISIKLVKEGDKEIYKNIKGSIQEYLTELFQRAKFNKKEFTFMDLHSIRMEIFLDAENKDIYERHGSDYRSKFERDEVEVVLRVMQAAFPNNFKDVEIDAEKLSKVIGLPCNVLGTFIDINYGLKHFTLEEITEKLKNLDVLILTSNMNNNFQKFSFRIAEYNLEHFMKNVEKAYLQLSSIFNLFGFIHEEEQCALVQLAAYQGCFGEEFKGKILVKAQIELLLQKSFSSFEEGVKWLVDVTQKNWLRPTFHQEGTQGKDLTINMERWKQADFKMHDNDQKSFFTCFNSLNLLNSVNWHDDFEPTVSYVAVHGALEKIVAERINFLKDFNGTLYYLTNPRGLFNDEPSLAPILAEWFGKPELTQLIQKTLDEHKDLNKSDKNWLKDLSGLKQLILQKTGETKWPTKKGWYERNQDVFERNCKQDGRQSLANWPTAMDMVEYLLKQRAIKEKGKFTNIILQPVYAERPGKVATREDLVEEWYKQYGKNISHNKTVYFISDNSLQHYIAFQHSIVEEVLYRLNLQPGLSCCKISTKGPGSDKLNIPVGLEALAKLIFIKSKRVLTKLKLPNDKDIEKDREFWLFDRESNRKIFLGSSFLFSPKTSTSFASLFKVIEDVKPSQSKTNSK